MAGVTMYYIFDFDSRAVIDIVKTETPYKQDIENLQVTAISELKDLKDNLSEEELIGLRAFLNIPVGAALCDIMEELEFCEPRKLKMSKVEKAEKATPKTKAEKVEKVEKAATKPKAEKAEKVVPKARIALIDSDILEISPSKCKAGSILSTMITAFSEFTGDMTVAELRRLIIHTHVLPKANETVDVKYADHSIRYFIKQGTLSIVDPL